MKRFGVNWWGILGANLAFYPAFVNLLLHARWAYRNDFVGDMRPILDTPFAFFLVFGAGLITYGEYRNYKALVRAEASGKSVTGKRAKPPDVAKVSRGTLVRWWLRGTSWVGVPYGALHFFAGWPSLWYVLLAAILLPALFVLGAAAKRHFFRSGVLNRERAVPLELPIAATPRVVPTVTQSGAEKAVLSVGSGKNP